MHEVAHLDHARGPYPDCGMFFILSYSTAQADMFKVRIVYRLVEFGPGVNAHNQLLIHEEYPLCLDATPILIALVLLNIMHPGFVLRGPDSEFPKLSRKEKKALKQQKKQEKKQAKEAKKARKAGAQELKSLSVDERSTGSRDMV